MQEVLGVGRSLGTAGWCPRDVGSSVQLVTEAVSGWRERLKAQAADVAEAGPDHTLAHRSGQEARSICFQYWQECRA